MPIVNHVIEYDPPTGFRVASVRGIFDFPEKKIQRSWSVEVPGVEESWNIGVVVGPSGSGKSQIVRKAYGAEIVEESPAWDSGPIIDSFPKCMSPNEICDLLSRVGLGSVPSWLLPYQALSNGQRFRADMARRIAENTSGLLVVDEFSSVVDRVVAKTTSAVVAKVMRRRAVKFVAVTCHYDVIEWLEPDWVLDMASGKLARGCLWRRPKIKLEIYECGREAWELFKMHHYLSAALPRQTTCYVGTVGGDVAAFVALINYPHSKYKSVIRVSRVVVLPDFQGLGLAVHMLRCISETQAKIVYISTTHGPFARALNRSGDWACCRGVGIASRQHKGATVKIHRHLVLYAGFRFIRHGNPKETIDPCTESDQRDEILRSPSIKGQK